MKKIIYSPIASIILYSTMSYLCWIYWSLPAIILYSIFMVLYSEGKYSWNKFKNNQNI